jgi:hypothetical protein
LEQWLVHVTQLLLSSLVPLAAGGDAGATSLLDELQPVQEAWQRLQRSGVLQQQARKVRRGSSVTMVQQLPRRAVEHCIMPFPAVCALRDCALAARSKREERTSQFKLCGACKSVVYCCKEHQAEDWRSHKASCRAMRGGSVAATASAE